MRDVTRLPEFKALKAAYAALEPLSPESRRKVIEALHALMKISPGRKPQHGMNGPGVKPRKKP